MLCSFSALDNYLGLPSLPFVFIETSAGITDLARIVDELRFPGIDIADGASDAEGRHWYFRCREKGEPTPNPSYCVLSLVQDLKEKRFFDEMGIYPQIRALRDVLQKKAEKDINVPPWWEDLHPRTGCFQALADGALILARYEALDYPPRTFIEALGREMEGRFKPGPEAQQVLLLGLMASPRPDRGLEFLKASGFLKDLWPEIARLDGVDHSKEFHPEGNAWKHTLRTFAYRKKNAAGIYDLRLSLALLLHDIGKPMALGSGSRRFDGHAELGARTAARFLERLGFKPELVEEVFYLVKNHMLPAALARLPLSKTKDIMSSPMFPSLMELYRCDESSSFKGLEGYYENSAAYQIYLRNMKNPFRSADGKKLANKKHRSYPK
jgi:poly(A) polymerase